MRAPAIPRMRGVLEAMRDRISLTKDMKMTEAVVDESMGLCAVRMTAKEFDDLP